MKRTEAGLPETGATARTLGVRPGLDIPLGTDTPPDLVRPGTGGMSVSTMPPTNLPRHRRPEAFDGTGRDPVWSLDTDELPDDLRTTVDPNDRTHVFIEPAYSMSFEAYLRYLHRTAHLWSLQ